MKLLTRVMLVSCGNEEQFEYLYDALDRGVELYYTPISTPSRDFSPEYVQIMQCELGLICVQDETETQEYKEAYDRAMDAGFYTEWQDDYEQEK